MDVILKNTDGISTSLKTIDWDRKLHSDTTDDETTTDNRFAGSKANQSDTKQFRRNSSTTDVDVKAISDRIIKLLQGNSTENLITSKSPKRFSKTLSDHESNPRNESYMQAIENISRKNDSSDIESTSFSVHSTKSTGGQQFERRAGKKRVERSSSFIS